MAICFRGVWTLPQSWLVYSWSYFPHQELVQTWDGTWFWSMRHERVCWGGRSVSGKAFAWVAGDRPSSCSQSSHLGCEDRNMKLEEPHWTMRKTSRSMLRQANSPGVDEDEASTVPLTWSHWTNQPQNHTRLIFIWGETLLFQFAETRFLVNIPNTHSARNQSGTMALYCQVFFSNSLMRPPLPRHISLPNSYSKPLADHSPVTPLGSSPASSPISLLFLRHSSFLCQTSEGSQF